MILQFDVVILILLVIVAIAALRAKDLRSAVIIYSVYGLLMCLLWAVMGAVDVAFTEAAVGAGVSTVFFIATIYRTNTLFRDQVECPIQTYILHCQNSRSRNLCE